MGLIGAVTPGRRVKFFGVTIFKLVFVLRLTGVKPPRDGRTVTLVSIGSAGLALPAFVVLVGAAPPWGARAGLANAGALTQKPNNRSIETAIFNCNSSPTKGLWATVLF